MPPDRSGDTTAPAATLNTLNLRTGAPIAAEQASPRGTYYSNLALDSAGRMAWIESSGAAPAQAHRVLAFSARRVVTLDTNADAHSDFLVIKRGYVRWISASGPRSAAVAPAL